MLNDTLLTFTQSLQMVALAPCIFVVVYLVLMSRSKALIIIPVLYFLSIIAGLVYLFLPAFFNYSDYPLIKAVLVMGDVLIPALSFLLIFQFMLNRVPSLWYWTIILVPIMAQGLFVYGYAYEGELCINLDICISSESILHLNNVIISSFIFILLILTFSRRSGEIIGNDSLRSYKYWLVLSLIIYNIILLCLDLALVDGIINLDKYAFAKTMVKVAFIYMVMTSIFRVFTDLFYLRPSNIGISRFLSKYERELAMRVLKQFEQNKVYEESGLNRAKLAEIMGVSEHILSRVINIEFKQSFSDFTAAYRIKEARVMLESTDVPITAISFDVGFNSIASFNRVFKNSTGKSPSEYRVDMKKDII